MDGGWSTVKQHETRNKAALISSHPIDETETDPICLNASPCPSLLAERCLLGPGRSDSISGGFTGHRSFGTGGRRLRLFIIDNI